MENSYGTKSEAQRDARKFKALGKYYVRVARTGWGKGYDQWAVYLRNKK